MGYKRRTKEQIIAQYKFLINLLYDNYLNRSTYLDMLVVILLYELVLHAIAYRFNILKVCFNDCNEVLENNESVRVLISILKHPRNKYVHENEGKNCLTKSSISRILSVVDFDELVQFIGFEEYGENDAIYIRLYFENFN